MGDIPAQEDKMHGSMFVLYKRYIENANHYSTWFDLLENAGLKGKAYQMHEMYPTRELVALLHATSEMTGKPTYEILERYGEFLVPDLLMVYRKYINPEWRTYDLILNTENTMHGAVRKEDGRTDPPILLVTKKGSNQLIVDYYSKRRMAGVAVGILKGLAKYYNEGDKVEVTCLTGINEERVQIAVRFTA